MTIDEGDLTPDYCFNTKKSCHQTEVEKFVQLDSIQRPKASNTQK